MRRTVKTVEEDGIIIMPEQYKEIIKLNLDEYFMVELKDDNETLIIKKTKRKDNSQIINLYNKIIIPKDIQSKINILKGDTIQIEYKGNCFELKK